MGTIMWQIASACQYSRKEECKKYEQDVIK